MSEFTEILRYEDLEPEAVTAIQGAFSGMQSAIMRVMEIDPVRGAGVLGPDSKCVWTKDGHRITVWQSSDGGRGGSCSKDPGPLANAWAR